MRTLSFPDLAVVQLCVAGRSGEWEPVPLAGVALGVHAFAGYKNDYDLGPFFSDERGIVTMTAAALQASAQAVLDSGIMDHQHWRDLFPLVEIRPRTGAELEREIEARRSWGLLPSERQLWASADELLALLQRAPNQRLRWVPNAGFGIVRDEWDGTGTSREYRLLIAPA